MADEKDYFAKLSRNTQPIRDVFSRQQARGKAAAKAAVPVQSSATKPIGQLQGESLEDFNYMKGAQERINKRLSPKSVMGKSSPKR